MSIYKKQSEDFKTFESAEEFLKYYENNKKDIDALHTRSLNLKYKINGHTIGRKLGKIILYPKKSEQKNHPQEQDVEETKLVIEQLKQAILQMNERLKIIEEYIDSQSKPIPKETSRTVTGPGVDHTLTPSSNFPLYYRK